MRENALKDKLTNRLNSGTDEITQGKDISKSGNVVPFINNDNQIISLVPDFAISLNEAKNRINMLQGFVREMMLQGVDFGIIPGCNKPSLFKPGAEKLCDIFGFSKHIEIINRLEDWDKGIFHYEVKAILISKKTGLVEAEGVGCCNNKEKKYKNMEAANIINTILKMAKKRAFVDAVLSATRSSGMFTQDIEDLDSQNDESVNPHTRSDVSTDISSVKAPENAVEEKAVTRKQLDQIIQIICQKKLPFNQAKDLMIQKYNVTESRYLSMSQADDFIKYLKNKRY